MAVPIRRSGRGPSVRLDPQVDFTGGYNAIEDRFMLAANESPDMLNVDVSRRGGVQRRKSVSDWGDHQPFGNTTRPEKLFEHRDQVNNTSKVVATAGGVGSTNMAFSIGAGWTSITNTGDCEILDHTMMNGKSWFAGGTDLTQSWGTPSGTPDAATDEIPDAHASYQNDYATATGDIFPKCRFLASHGGFMWAAYTDEGVNVHPTRVRFSHPGYADRWAEDDWIDVGDEDGDEIVKIASFRDQLLVFLNRSVYAVLGYSRQNFQVVKVSSSVGATNANGVCVNPDGVWFFSPDRGVYYYNGDGEPRWAFEKVYPLMERGEVDTSSLDEVYVASVLGRVWVRVPMTDYTSRCFVLDPSTGAWVVYDVDMLANVEFQNADYEVIHVAATGTEVVDPDGLTAPVATVGLVELETNAAIDTFNEAATSTQVGISSYFKTRWLDSGSPFLPKRYKRPEFIMAGPSAHTVQAEVYLDYYDGEARKTLLIEMAGTGSSDSLVWDDDDGDPPYVTEDLVDHSADNPGSFWDNKQWAYGTATTQDEVVRGGSIGGTGRSVALKFRGPTNVQWEIRGFTLKYLPKKPRS